MELLDHRISALYECFSSFAFSPTLDVVIVFNLVILVGVYFVKHLFKSFAHFSAQLYVFSYSLWESFFFGILDTNPLSYLYREYLTLFSELLLHS